MADVQVVREDGHGERTVLTLRVPDTAWAGLDAVVEIIDVAHLIPVQRKASE